MGFQSILLFVCGIAGGIVIVVSLGLLRRFYDVKRLRKNNDQEEG